MKEIERIKTALDLSNEVVYEWDINKGTVKWTGDIAQLLKIKKPITSRDEFLKQLSATDLKKYKAKVEESIATKESFECSYNFKGGAKTALKVTETGRHFIDFQDNHLMVGVIKLNRATNSISEISDLDTGFTEKIDKVINNAKVNKTSGCYMKISIDNLALITAWFNMNFADEIMKKICDGVEKVLGKTAIVKRVYIDQLGVLLPETTREQAETKAKKIYNMLEDFEYQAFKKPMHITASMGAVDFPGTSDNGVDAINKAYLALNIAKNSSENYYYDYHEAEKQQSHSKSQTMLMHYVHDAVKDNKIRFAYQPIIESKTGKVHAYECLIRITGSDGRVNSPGAIIPIAEKMGFIDTIDQLVLEKVVEDLKENPDVTLSFNASSLTTINPKWLKLCTKLLSDSKLASRVIVEITETAAQRDLREAAYFVASLQALGCTVALDDFGAGYTSFRQLKTLSVDVIKIDGAFVREIAKYPDNKLFVKTLLDFTNCYGTKTVAECVEDGESARILIDMNVDYLQGYYFGAPEIFPSWLAASKKLKS